MGRPLTWYPPASTGLPPIVLTDRAAGYRVHKGARGLGAVERDLILVDAPWADGTTVEGDFAAPRHPMLPMSIYGVTRGEFLDRLRALTASMRTRDEPGELELQQADGRRFRVRCYYMSGLPNEETFDSGGDTNWVRFPLQMLAPDPYWYAAEPTVLRWQYSEPRDFLATPILPLKLSAGAVLGDVTLSNPGAANAHALWRITGPGTGIIFDLTTTGETLRINGTIPAGQTLTVVTEPGLQDINLDGTDWWPYLQDGSSLWTIPAGDTSASVAVTGSGPGTTVELEFSPRFGAPW